MACARDLPVGGVAREVHLAGLGLGRLAGRERLELAVVGVVRVREADRVGVRVGAVQRALPAFGTWGPWEPPRRADGAPSHERRGGRFRQPLCRRCDCLYSSVSRYGPCDHTIRLYLE